MVSTTDFEKLLFMYKTEGKGVSLETFCIRNGVNYRTFDKWYRNKNKHKDDIVPVQVVGAPEQSTVDNGDGDSKSFEHETLITMSLLFNNGMYIRRKHLTYAELKELVAKVEGLC